jgi:hypothetical protein
MLNSRRSRECATPCSQNSKIRIVVRRVVNDHEGHKGARPTASFCPTGRNVSPYWNSIEQYKGLCIFETAVWCVDKVCDAVKDAIARRSSRLYVRFGENGCLAKRRFSCTCKRLLPMPDCRSFLCRLQRSKYPAGQAVTPYGLTYRLLGPVKGTFNVVVRDQGNK